MSVAAAAPVAPPLVPAVPIVAEEPAPVPLLELASLPVLPLVAPILISELAELPDVVPDPVPVLEVEQAVLNSRALATRNCGNTFVVFIVQRVRT
jgi:hypothetical protein